VSPKDEHPISLVFLEAGGHHGDVLGPRRRHLVSSELFLLPVTISFAHFHDVDVIIRHNFGSLLCIIDTSVEEVRELMNESEGVARSGSRDLS